MRTLRVDLPLLSTAFLAVLGGWALMKLLGVMHMGCEPARCGRAALMNGFSLFGGAVLLAALGGTLVSGRAQEDSGGPLRPVRLFASLAVGLVVVMTYVVVRSFFNHAVWDLPLTRAELVGLSGMVVLAGWFIRRARNPGQSLAVNGQTLVLDLLLLLLLCVVIANREIPRLVNLSTDPDFHVFYAIQIERFGGVPFHLRDWGPLSFNYPSGSGVLLYVWHQFTDISPGHLIVVLPLLFTFWAALLIAEVAGRDTVRAGHRLVIQLAVVSVTAAGFLFPLYKEYFHLEGAARQMSILLAAAFLGFVVDSARGDLEATLQKWWIPTLFVFVLTTFNPVKVVLPAVMLSALFVYLWVQGRPKAHLVFVLVGAFLLLLFDPYYQVTFGVAESIPFKTIEFDERFASKSLDQVVTGAWQTWTQKYGMLLREFAILFEEKGRPHFLSFFLVYGFALVILIRQRPSRAAVWGVLTFLTALFVVYGFARSLQLDQRFFLLGPYIFFNMTQYKALLLTLMLVLILQRLLRWPLGAVWAVLAAVPLIYLVMQQVRSVQEMYLGPRKDYCGAFGCVEPGDLRLLKAMEDKAKAGGFPKVDGVTPRILVPNESMRTEHESWIFPVSSARLLPSFEVLPAAFYFFQGEPYYGTKSYNERVCEKLDRQWLRERNILYVYLPSGREHACMAGMEQLMQTEEVVLQEGNAYLLKLR